MPSAFNDDVQFGLQVSRPTNLYALKALQLREKVFQWIARHSFWVRIFDDIWWYSSYIDFHWCQDIIRYLSGPWFQICIVHQCASMHQQQSIVVFFRAKASQKYRFDGDADSTPSSSGSVFASLSQWYDHARTVWQTLSMCGTDLLQFRTMRCQRCILLKTIRNVSR